MNTGAVADGVLLSKRIAPPEPVMLCTSSVQTGITGKAGLGNVKVTVGEAVNVADPAVIVNWQLCEYPENVPFVVPVPQPPRD